MGQRVARCCAFAFIRRRVSLKVSPTMPPSLLEDRAELQLRRRFLQFQPRCLCVGPSSEGKSPGVPGT